MVYRSDLVAKKLKQVDIAEMHNSMWEHGNSPALASCSWSTIAKDPTTIRLLELCGWSLAEYAEECCLRVDPPRGLHQGMYSVFASFSGRV